MGSREQRGPGSPEFRQVTTVPIGPCRPEGGQAGPIFITAITPASDINYQPAGPGYCATAERSHSGVGRDIGLALQPAVLQVPRETFSSEIIVAGTFF